MAKITVIENNPELKGLVDLKGNIVFAKPDGKELALHLMKPMWASEHGEGFPLVVFIQGSSWTKPNQFWEIPQLCQLARRGFVVATVTHRSCFEAKAPAFLEDVKTAIRFLRAHAEKYDIDPERVCAWGTSSGGNTALLLGLTGDDPRFESGEWPGQSTKVKCVVDCFGPTDLNRMVDVQYAHVQPTEDNVMLALSSMDSEERHRMLDEISPIRYAEPGKDYPPFLLLHGDADPIVLYSDTETFYNRMIECGYEADLVRVTNAPHEGNFWSETLLEMIFEFIQKNV